MDELNTDQIIDYLKKQTEENLNYAKKDVERLEEEVRKQQIRLVDYQDSLKEARLAVSINLTIKENLDRPNLILFNSEE